MRSEKLYEALTQVDGALIDEAATPPEKQPKKAPRLRWLGAVAAVLALVLVLTAVLRPGDPGGLTACALETAAYPDAAPYPDLSGLMGGETYDREALEEAYELWAKSQQLRSEARKNYSPEDLRAYLTAVLPAFLGGREGENVSCSPVNLYLALAMLAETTGGESRDQILSLLGAADIDSLRTLAANLFLANYGNDGATKSLLAGALWLRDDMDYKADTVKRLAETYYASSYQGTMGSEVYNQLLRDWLNAQTGGHLADQIGSLGFDGDTVLAITTTVDFSAQWNEEFQVDLTDDGVFHARSGDVSCRMMHREYTGAYCWGEKVGATGLNFKNGGSMRFLLPDEGVTPEALLEDPEALSFLLPAKYGSWSNCKHLRINLTLPKFDIASQLSLETTLRDLGLTDVTNPDAADFSPLTGSKGVYLSEVKHGTRVAVDEKGVTASAYIMMIGAGAAMPPDEQIDFTLDRPFLFAIYGPDNLPLFVGIVNQP